MHRAAAILCLATAAVASSAIAADVDRTSTPTRYIPDLKVPAMAVAPPAAGRRVRHVLDAYRGTSLYHALYLPTDWKAGGRYPVIVEYPGNRYGPDRNGDVCTGRPEHCNLGYGQSGGRGFVWISIPFVNAKKGEVQVTWWGDVEATVSYCKAAVADACARFGGDPKAVFLTGFSRGAIACSYIGLHDDAIAKLWRGLMPHSHFDGVRKWNYAGSDRGAAMRRLARLKGRPVFASHETPKAAGNSFLKSTALGATRQFVEGVDARFTFQPVGTARHTDTWVLEDRPERRALRRWLKDVLKAQP